jgi:hypothetical protein
MEELYRCRKYAEIAIGLLAEQPMLGLIPLASAVPAALSLVLLAVLGSHENNLIPILVVFGACSALMTLVRVWLATAVMAVLRGQPWTLAGTLRAAVANWRSALLFGLLDGVATELAGLLIIYVLMGSIAAGWWWCMAGLVPCAIASGYSDFSRALVRAERILSMVRLELMVAAGLLNLLLLLLLQIALHLGLGFVLTAEIILVLVQIPLRELVWQLFVTVVYYHTAPV